MEHSDPEKPEGTGKLTMKLPAVVSGFLSNSENQNVNDTSSYQKGEKNLSQRPEIHKLIIIKKNTNHKQETLYKYQEWHTL